MHRRVISQFGQQQRWNARVLIVGNEACPPYVYIYNSEITKITDARARGLGCNIGAKKLHLPIVASYLTGARNFLALSYLTLSRGRCLSRACGLQYWPISINSVPSFMLDTIKGNDRGGAAASMREHLVHCAQPRCAISAVSARDTRACTRIHR